MPGGSVGFTLVLNAYEENFHRAGYILSTLTDFLSVMIQNRNNISEALSHSLRDPMTGVLNRAGLAKYLSTRKRQETAAFISGDINGLKEENDRHGHLSGDHLIRGISDILVSFADKDHVVRMGGDEFLMIKEGMDDAGARDLIQKIKNTCQTEGYSIALGYTIHSGSIGNMDDIVRKADRAMYEDKGHYYHRRRSDSPFDRRKHE
ncbi:MAG: GGDEF domain-containing protein [Lactimicrobium massiliense]|nr:GGDEF domain-containing protein [Lactimicrobium massiliense]MDD6229840.1 GGDEF domain-containing protein [Lactimicrobium massiliense]